MLPITALTAAALAPAYIWLALRIVSLRRKAQVSFGDHGNTDLLRAVRTHGNFGEYVPFGLIMLGLMELNGLPVWITAALALLLVLGRLCHGYAFIHRPMNYNLRAAGMISTFTMLGLSAIALFVDVIL